MKIVFLMIFGDIGGAEFVTYQHALIAKENNLDFFVLCTSKGVFYDRMLKEKINVIYAPELLTSDKLKYLEKYLKDVDVVYNCNYFNITSSVVELKKKYNFKYITVVHSNIDWVFSQLKSYDNITDYYLATHTLIVSEMIKSKFPKEKIIFIPNSINISEVPCTNNILKSKLKKELGIPGNDLVIGMTTRINYDKNVNDIVRIMNLINQKRSTSLVIIGDACYSDESFKYKEQLLKLIKESPYKDKFHLLGKPPTSKDVYDKQRVFDIAINISPSEGTPMSLFEHMAGGIYCIYPSIGGIPEVLNNNGSVIPIRQRIILEEINMPHCYTDEEIQLYVNEIFKLSKEYLTEKGLKSRDYISENRDISIYKNRLMKFMTCDKKDVSVLLTVYNTPVEWLKESIESILNQTYSEFEFVIIDDCSTNKDTIELLKDYEKKDKRIKLFFKLQNDGLGFTLNYGVRHCSSELVIKMDADDIAYPDLIKKQVEYFKNNPNTVVCGIQLKCFGNHNQITNHPEIITKESLLRLEHTWVMNHPGVAYKRDVILSIGGYEDGKEICEDYNLWCRLLKAGYVLNNQKEVLMNYRSNDSSYTHTLCRTKTYNESLVRSRKLLAGDSDDEEFYVSADNQCIIKKNKDTSKKETQPDIKESIGLVIPYYNRPKYFKKTLDCLSNAVIPEFTSALLIDDCSRERESKLIALNFDKKGLIIHKEFNKTNIGIVENLKKGFKFFYEKEVDIFCNLDSDVIFDKMLFFELLRLHKRFPNRIISAFNIANSNQSKIIKEYDEYYERDFVGGMNLFFGKDKYGLVMEALSSGEKWDFKLAELLKKKNESFITTKPSYVQHIGMTSSDTLNHFAKWQSDYNPK